MPHLKYFGGLAGAVVLLVLAFGADAISGESVVTKTLPEGQNPSSSPSTASPMRDLKVEPTPDEKQPVTHARQAGITTCLPTIATEANKTIISDHTAASSWSKTAPNEKTFYSAIGMKDNNSLAPNVFSLMTVTPSGDRCVGQVVQVYPVKRKCKDIQNKLLENGTAIGQLERIAYMQVAQDTRVALIPGEGRSCTVIQFHVSLPLQ